MHPSKTICFERKSIHIYFSLKKGMSDTTSYLECIVLLYRYMKCDNY